MVRQYQSNPEIWRPGHISSCPRDQSAPGRPAGGSGPVSQPQSPRRRRGRGPPPRWPSRRSGKSNPFLMPCPALPGPTDAEKAVWSWVAKHAPEDTPLTEMLWGEILRLISGWDLRLLTRIAARITSGRITFTFRMMFTMAPPVPSSQIRTRYNVIFVSDGFLNFLSSDD